MTMSKTADSDLDRQQAEENPKTARDVAEFLLDDLLQYPSHLPRGAAYKRDVRHLTAALEAWAERTSGPTSAVARCEWCDWMKSFSAETIAEEAHVLRAALIDHCETMHREKFKSPRRG